MSQTLESVLDKLSKHPVDAQKQALIEVLKDEFKESLYLTAKYLLGYKDLNKRTHGDVIKCLESPSKRKLIVMPRGTLKSSLGTVAFSIWSLLKNPNERIMIDSEVYSNSKNFLREIKSHLESPMLNLLFGRFKSDNCWNEGEIIINQRTKSFKEASITCSGIGAVKVGQHYSIIIEDDLNSNNNSLTREGCEKVINHYKMNTSILEPDGVIAVIGTRYSQNDLIQNILDNEVNA